MFDGSRLDPDPRTLLKSVLDAVEAQGWQAMSGAEFEYFQFSETMKSLKQKGYTGLDSLTPGSKWFSQRSCICKRRKYGGQGAEGSARRTGCSQRGY